MLNKTIILLFISTISVALMGMEQPVRIPVNPMNATIIGPKIPEDVFEVFEVKTITQNGNEYIIVFNSGDTTIPSLTLSDKNISAAQEHYRTEYSDFYKEKESFLLRYTKENKAYCVKIKRSDFDNKLLKTNPFPQPDTPPKKSVKPPAKKIDLPPAPQKPAIIAPTMPDSFDSPDNTYQDPYPKPGPISTSTEFIDYINQFDSTLQNYLLYGLRSVITERNDTDERAYRNKLATALQRKSEEIDDISAIDSMDDSNIIVHHYGTNQGKFRHPYPPCESLTDTSQLATYMQKLTPGQQKSLIQESSTIIEQLNSEPKNEYYARLSSLQLAELRKIDMSQPDQKSNETLNDFARHIFLQHRYHQKNDPDLTLDQFLQPLLIPIRQKEKVSEIKEGDNSTPMEDPNSLTSKFNAVKNRAERYAKQDKEISKKFNRKAKRHEEDVNILQNELQKAQSGTFILSPIVVTPAKKFAQKARRNEIGLLMASGIVTLFINPESIEKESMEILQKDIKALKKALKENDVEKAQKKHAEKMLSEIEESKKKLFPEKKKKMTKEELFAAAEKRFNKPKESHE